MIPIVWKTLRVIMSLLQIIDSMVDTLQDFCYFFSVKQKNKDTRYVQKVLWLKLQDRKQFKIIPLEFNPPIPLMKAQAV